MRKEKTQIGPFVLPEARGIYESLGDSGICPAGHFHVRSRDRAHPRPPFEVFEPWPKIVPEVRKLQNRRIDPQLLTGVQVHFELRLFFGRDIPVLTGYARSIDAGDL